MKEGHDNPAAYLRICAREQRDAYVGKKLLAAAVQH